MARQQSFNPFGQPQGQRAFRIRPRRPQKRYRFRKNIIIVLVTLIVALWIVSSVVPICSWDRLMDLFENLFGLERRGRCTLFMCLLLTCITILAVARVLCKHKEA